MPKPEKQLLGVGVLGSSGTPLITRMDDATLLSLSVNWALAQTTTTFLAGKNKIYINIHYTVYVCIYWKLGLHSAHTHRQGRENQDMFKSVGRWWEMTHKALVSSTLQMKTGHKSGARSSKLGRMQLWFTEEERRALRGGLWVLVCMDVYMTF